MKPENKTHSSPVNPLLSFKSAPEQNAPSTSLATISALVGPSGPSDPTEFISLEKALRRAREMALREEGLLSERMRMEPVWGAGMERAVMSGPEAVL